MRWLFLLSTVLSLNLSCLGPRRLGKKGQSSRALVVTPKGEGVFHLGASEARSWEALIAVLIRDYPLNFIDREGKLAATGWKAVYHEDQVVRTRLSVQIVPLARRQTELRLHSQAEVLSNGAGANLRALGLVWLPYSGQLEEPRQQLLQGLSQALSGPRAGSTARAQADVLSENLQAL